MVPSHDTVEETAHDSYQNTGADPRALSPFQTECLAASVALSCQKSKVQISVRRDCAVSFACEFGAAESLSIGRCSSSPKKSEAARPPRGAASLMRLGGRELNRFQKRSRRWLPLSTLRSRTAKSMMRRQRRSRRSAPRLVHHTSPMPKTPGLAFVGLRRRPPLRRRTERTT